MFQLVAELIIRQPVRCFSKLIDLLRQYFNASVSQLNSLCFASNLLQKIETDLSNDISEIRIFRSDKKSLQI